MASAVPQAIAVSKALETVLRQDRGRIMAALTYQLRSIQLAEDALHEACISALTHWGREGLPHSPQGWLIRVAFRKALDQIRSESRSAERDGASAQLAELLSEEVSEEIPDERLRLIFVCCHPALEWKSRVALTLRTVCGLSTGEIARLFLDAESTMGQRLSRAKTKIEKAGIPFVVPHSDQWEERLQAVLTTIYLIFTTGYTNKKPDEARTLCEEALFLAGLLQVLCPEQAEVEGAFALLLLTDARHAARVSRDGATVPPSLQDKLLWDSAKEQQGLNLLSTALNRRRAGPFQLKAAISACQMARPAPDWAQSLHLYTALLALEDTPVVRVNHAIALAETGHVAAALHALQALETELAEFQPFHAAFAEVLAKNGQEQRALRAYEKAIALAETDSDRLFLIARKANPPHQEASK